MYQLEIEYFFPLTEQILLDLDFTPCTEYEAEKQRKWLGSCSGQILCSSGTGLTWANPAPTSYQFKPRDSDAGCWCIGDDEGIQVWRPKRPNWLHQAMTKFFFGWKWKDK